MKKKSGASSTSVRTYRLCVLGPSFVGKTQLINRFVNNSFSPYYDPTLHANIYKRAFPLNDNGEEGGSQQNGEQYVKIELIDCFPHDHPALEGDTSDITPGGGDVSDDLTQEMSTTLNAIVKNNLEGKFGLPPGIGTSILGKIHGYVYVYDASNKNTFETLTCLIDTVREIEKSERRGKKVVVYSPKKLVLGNKRDLIQVATAQQNRIEKSQLQKLEINKHRTVSAMTNHGVMEAFRALINEIHSCSILYKEFHDEERKRGKEAAIDEFATGAQGQDGRSSILGGSKKSNHTRGGPLQQQGGGGLLNMLPFFNCYAARDDIHLEDQEEEYEEEDVQIEGQDGEDDTTSTGGRQQRRDAQNGNGGCNIV